MRLLLDTHAFLWWLEGRPRLGRRARNAIADPSTQVFVSAASIWEIAIKLAIGKLLWKPTAKIGLADCIAVSGFDELPVRAVHAAAVRELPRHHDDPFDRLLVAQAAIEDLPILTSDAALAPYSPRTVAADE